MGKLGDSMFKVDQDHTYEAIVIGGGPGGYVAAIWLAKAGVKTCIVEGHKFGGTCLNYGCIPTKALYHYAKTIHTIHKHQDIGISTRSVELDFSKIMEQKYSTIDTLVNGVAALVDKNNISIKHGVGSFLDDHHVKVMSQSGEEEILFGKNIIIATGSTPILPPISGLKENLEKNLVITSKEALNIETIPEQLVIIGGGVIGMEFATIYNQFGSRVTVIEATDSVLPNFNKDLVKRYKPLAKKQGISILTGAMVTKVSSSDHQIASVSYTTKKGDFTIDADKVICAVGRKPLFNDLELHNLTEQVHNDRQLLVNDVMETTLNHIYGIGDVNGLSMLAHSASKQGIIASTKIINKLSLENPEICCQEEPMGFSTYAIPQVAFLLPEISQTSRPIDVALENIASGKFTYRSNGMALAIQEKDGICKVDYDTSNNQLSYMGILGESSAELIQLGVHMIDHNLSYKGLVDSVVGHPSLSEILHEALLDTHRQGIHQL